MFQMYFCRNKVFITCAVIAVCSIVQTILHLVWLFYGHYIYECDYKPKDIFVHLISITYFYRETCFKTRMIDTELFCSDITKGLFEDKDNAICQLGHDINIRAIVVSDFGPNTLKTVHIFDLVGTLDCLWLIASVALLMGSWLKIKEAWSVLFYAPWLILTTILSMLDILLTWKYIYDCLNTKNVEEWLKFMGVRNYGDFSIYNDKISWKFTSMSSMIMCAVACRLVIFGVLNLVSVVLVLRGATLAYSLSYVDETVRRRRRPILLNDTLLGDSLNLDATAARIRSWQMFYGSDAPSGGSDGGSERSSSDPNSSEKNPSSGSAYSIPVIGRELQHVDPEWVRNDYMSAVNGHNNRQTSAVVELRGQLPWSYVPEDTQTRYNMPAASILRKPPKYAEIDSGRNSAFMIEDTCL